MTLTGLDVRGPHPEDSSAPISAAFSSLEVAVEPPPVSKAKTPADVLIGLPVREEDCPELERRLEGNAAVRTRLTILRKRS